MRGDSCGRYKLRYLPLEARRLVAPPDRRYQQINSKENIWQKKFNPCPARALVSAISPDLSLASLVISHQSSISNQQPPPCPLRCAAYLRPLLLLHFRARSPSVRGTKRGMDRAPESRLATWNKRSVSLSPPYRNPSSHNNLVTCFRKISSLLLVHIAQLISFPLIQAVTRPYRLLRLAPWLVPAV